MSDRVNIKLHNGEEVEFFAAMPDSWIKTSGSLVEATDRKRNIKGYYALMMEQAEGDAVQMALVSLVSGTKLGDAKISSYEEAMQSRCSFVADTLKFHLDQTGGLQKSNELHAFRLAQIIAEHGPQQEQPCSKKKKEKKKGRSNE